MSEIIHHILTFLTGLGYWGIMLGLAIEVIPSEIVLSYAGYLVQQGKIDMLEAVAFGTFGIMIAQLILYWIGRYGGRPFVEKYGKYMLLKKKYIDVAEKWFVRYGAGVVFTARFIPVVRQAISIPAGMARMPLGSFLFFTALSTIPWALMFVYIGKTLGENWQDFHEKAAPYMQPIIYAAVILTALYLGYKLLTGKNKKSGGSSFKNAESAGAAGEKAVAHQLRFLGREYKVFHRKLVEAGGDRQEIDHLVVGPGGVFHIETKHWSGSIAFTDQGVERDHGRHAEDPTAQLYRHEYIIKELMQKHRLEADVVGILCFSNANGQITGKSPAFHTVKLDRLVHFIRSYKPKQRLSDSHIRKIGETIRAKSRPKR